MAAQLASSVIIDNSAILLVGGGAAISFALVTMVWLYLYASLLLVGYTTDSDPSMPPARSAGRRRPRAVP